MLLSSLPEKRAKNSFINMIGSLPKKCLLGLVGTPGGEAGGARAGPRRGVARAPRDGRTPRGRRPDGLDVGSESAGRLSAGRRGLTTVLNVTQQNVSIPRTSFLQRKSWRLQSYSATTTRNRTLENSLTGHERQESHPNTPSEYSIPSKASDRSSDRSSRRHASGRSLVLREISVEIYLQVPRQSSSQLQIGRAHV